MTESYNAVKEALKELHHVQQFLEVSPPKLAHAAACAQQAKANILAAAKDTGDPAKVAEVRGFL